MSTLDLTPKRIARFWSRCEKQGDCLVWTGARVGSGYGQLRVGKAVAVAHRVSYEIVNGPIPDGLIVRHKCDNPPCVRPEHLEVGTHADNTRDMYERGRARQAISDADVVTAREMRAAGANVDEIAERFGMTSANASFITRGVTRKSVGGPITKGRTCARRSKPALPSSFGIDLTQLGPEPPR